jgi:hypothetical protein
MASALAALSPESSGEVFVEGWAQSYGSPYSIPDDDEGVTDVELMEDGPFAHPGVDAPEFSAMAFVDGVRRGEASLYQIVDGRFIRGIAGAHACGAVIAEAGERLRFDEVRVARLLIWGGGALSPLQAVTGGWQWQAASIASDDPQGPLADLQLRMRNAEGRLAEALADQGILVIADGPLNFALRRDRSIVGYVKRHQRAYLPREQHALVPQLGAGERSTLFRVGDERFSCYLRLTDEPFGGPWAGIVRLEFSTSTGIEATRPLANVLTFRLPRYAGLLYRDPRAPQNLQPIGALETHLRRHLGSEALAERAVREAVRYAQGAAS